MDSNTRVLCIQELLLTIFQNCDKPTAAAAARVCKAWEGPALDVLWTDIPRLSIIFHLFGLTNASDWDLSTQRSPASFGSQEWAVFSKYAPRIRTLCVTTPHPQDSEVLQAISNSRSQLHILPNLISLHWDAGGPEKFLGLAFLFLSPSLRSVRLSCDAPRTGSEPPSHKDRIRILERMPSQVPVLQSLTLENSFQLSSDSEDTLCRVLSGLQCLEKVALPMRWTTNSILKTLGCLPELRHLFFDFGLNEFIRPSFVPPPVPDASYNPAGSFPSLRHLSLLDMELGYIAHFLHAFQHTHMTSVDIGFPFLQRKPLQSHASPQLPAVLDKLALTWPLIESVSIDLHDPHVIGTDGVTSSVFRPLLRCTQMVHFRAVTSGEYCFTDGDMREFAMAWPELRSFHLRDGTVDEQAASRLSPEALVHFARYCPNIEEIGLYMDLTTWRYEPANIPPSVVFTRLTGLHFGGSDFTPQRWTEIADFLVAICPRDVTLQTELEEPFKEHLAMCYVRAPDDLSDSEMRIQFWKTVQLVHGILRRRDAEHRAHVRHLEIEVVALRQQLAIHGVSNV